MPHYLDIISRIARRYTLPERCPITRDDLIQEACLALLERAAVDSNFSLALSERAAALNQPSMDERKVYAIARKAMQKAISRYVSPVTRSLDDVIYRDDSGNTVTLADTIAVSAADTIAATAADTAADTIAAAAADTATATAEAGAITAFISDLDALLAAGTITPAAYRKRKQRFLHRLRRDLATAR